jgi:VCBS repeat-containing protein
VPGTYTGAVRYPFQGAGQPGLSVYGNGRASNTLTGQFTVTQADFDAAGNLVSFAASFEQHSEGATPALTGQVNINFTNGRPDGVLYNDSDPDPGTTLAAVLVNGPAHGGLSLNADGSLTYTPDPNFFGTDTFTYRASDGLLSSNIATATITVAHVNRAPVAVDDSYSTVANRLLTIAAPGLLVTTATQTGTPSPPG